MVVVLISCGRDLAILVLLVGFRVGVVVLCCRVWVFSASGCCSMYLVWWMQFAYLLCLWFGIIGCSGLYR